MDPDDAFAIAIVGYGGVFPGCTDDLAAFWANVCGGVDATTEVPAGRWALAPDRAFDPAIARADKVYATRGGFVGPFQIEHAGLNLDPALLSRLDPVFQLALHAAVLAWRSTHTREVDLDRAGVVFGNIVLPTEKSSEFSSEILGTVIEEALGLPASRTEPTDPLNAFPAGLPATLVAQALGLRGAAFTLDAACASSLYAIKLAIDELRSGRADVMLTGGVSRPDPLYTQMGFSQLRALSARGKAAPFDALADGLIVGEGAGLFVLKRLGDAVSHGDVIHGLIRGIGLSNDLHGDVLAPSSEGQIRAMRAAYEQAGWSPHEVDLIECHATGTPVGDAVEAESLKRLWGDRDTGWQPGQCVIGSVKSNLGHTLTAAGAAGLLKVLLAFKHRVLPPTANFTRAAPALGLEDSPFRVLSAAEAWPAREPGRPRRAAISGFGFGGINAHLLVEDWEGTASPGSHSPEPARQHARPRHRSSVSGEPIAIVGMAAHFGPLGHLSAFQQRVLGGRRDQPARPGRWWGLPQTAWFRDQHPDTDAYQGYYVNSFRVRVDQFRIPPRELEQMLPQQSLMLKVAAQAMEDARWNASLALRTGVLIGLGLDQNTANYQLRWRLAEQVPDWNEVLELGLSPRQVEEWIESLRQSVGPALSANRTMGSLGGLVASRIARQFRIGGPSFSISCDEASGTQALQVALDWLRSGELDAAVVGAVDLAGDVRSVLATRSLGAITMPGEGAAALVLKRQCDAIRDGNRIYAVITGAVSVTCRSMPSLGRDPENDANVFASATADIGAAGAAAGLASVVKTALCLFHQVIPASAKAASSGGESAGHPTTIPSTQGPRYWLRNRAEGPRRAVVSAFGLGGTCHHLILESLEESGPLETSIESQRVSPLGPRRLGLFAVEASDVDGLLSGSQELIRLMSEAPEQPIEQLARRWRRKSTTSGRLALGMAAVGDRADSVIKALKAACGALAEGRDVDPALSERTGARVYLPQPALGTPARIAFVYPGLGNAFAGMGREIALLWPEVLRSQDARNGYLRDQFAAQTWWDGDLPALDDHRAPILGQVSLGSLTTDLFRRLGVLPDAAIGYSMGESAALMSLGAWTDRDEMTRRLMASPLFATELAGTCEAARRSWNLEPGEPALWVAGIVPCSSARVEQAIGNTPRVYVLIINSAEETVIGGRRPEVLAVVSALGCSFVELPTVSTVHCEIGRCTLPEYRALHDLPTITPAGISFYSGVSARPYQPDQSTAADAITAQATGTIDFPAVIERAYADGVRIFLEMGPGGSCTRLIDRIVGERPHLARAACLPGRDALGTVLGVLASLVAHRVPIDLDGLYPEEPLTSDVSDSGLVTQRNAREIVIEPGAPPLELPGVPRGSLTVTRERSLPAHAPLTRQLLATEHARGNAHGAFLRVSNEFSALIGKSLEFQLNLLDSASGSLDDRECEAPAEPFPQECDAPAASVFLDRAQCLDFAVGSIGSVLGPSFASIDSHPTRVRLPDEPLMLVDRIVSVEGEERSLMRGRVVTEHDILPGAWYLDAGKIPACIAIESGQADLFLSAYLGIDFVTRGKAVYRLLDATVTFHRALPAPGDVIRYAIRITRFFRQGDTHLFRFEFDGTVDDEPVLTMRDGCAGFFSARELAEGKGIVPRPLDSRARQGVRPVDWADLVPVAVTSLNERQVDALRTGDLGGAFGSPFDRLDLEQPLTLPGGRMTLVHRVEALDPTGGPYGLGMIRAEADIHADDWFMVCHFVDDRVMPGTLMYECCLHTLRIFLMRMGWIGSRGQVSFEPLPGVANRLRCRGQVIESTRKVTYEVVIRELGYRPEPYAIADALMYADGKPIVEITDMALRLVGATRAGLERLWAPGSQSHHETRTKALYSRDRILAFATGKPSDGFGDRYLPFDEGRFIARLPAPPYSFLDRIVHIDGKPWIMAAGTSAESEYDILPDAWYFEADRQDHVPYAVLLEAALQSCGWVAAYMGSALSSDEPLKFRNLGGTGRQHAVVDRWSGTLTTSVQVTKITRSAGMIIQHYDFSVRAGDVLVYDGETYFGFFHPDALTEQAGIRDAPACELTTAEKSRGRSFAIPDRPPFPDPRWRMIESIETLDLEGGRDGLGMIVGRATVDPEAWFFKAHFLHDPVWPGSLGLESFLQLLKVVAAERWDLGEDAVFESPAIGSPHRWVYRGQILPSSGLVTTRAEITSRDDKRGRITASGYLLVDGKAIYQMNDFTIGVNSRSARRTGTSGIRRD